MGSHGRGFPRKRFGFSHAAWLGDAGVSYQYAMCCDNEAIRLLDFSQSSGYSMNSGHTGKEVLDNEACNSGAVGYLAAGR